MTRPQHTAASHLGPHLSAPRPPKGSLGTLIRASRQDPSLKRRALGLIPQLREGQGTLEPDSNLTMNRLIRVFRELPRRFSRPGDTFLADGIRPQGHTRHQQKTARPQSTTRRLPSKKKTARDGHKIRSMGSYALPKYEEVTYLSTMRSTTWPSSRGDQRALEPAQRYFPRYGRQGRQTRKTQRLPRTRGPEINKSSHLPKDSQTSLTNSSTRNSRWRKRHGGDIDSSDDD